MNTGDATAGGAVVAMSAAEYERREVAAVLLDIGERVYLHFNADAREERCSPTQAIATAARLYAAARVEADEMVQELVDNQAIEKAAPAEQAGGADDETTRERVRQVVRSRCKEAQGCEADLVWLAAYWTQSGKPLEGCDTGEIKVMLREEMMAAFSRGGLVTCTNGGGFVRGLAVEL